MWVLGIAFILFAAITVFFKLPFSRTAAEFTNISDSKLLNMDNKTDIFTDNDMASLPLPVQKFFRHCGYLGTPKMKAMKANFTNVDFKLSATKTIKIDYVQYNFVEKPERFAYINSSLFGVPFEGLDSYQNGTGSCNRSILLDEKRPLKMDVIFYNMVFL